MVMAFPYWFYKDPQLKAVHKDKYTVGCEVCSKNQFDKSRRSWHCILYKKEFPNLDAFTCKDWRKRK